MSILVIWQVTEGSPLYSTHFHWQHNLSGIEWGCKKAGWCRGEILNDQSFPSCCVNVMNGRVDGRFQPLQWLSSENRRAVIHQLASPHCCALPQGCATPLFPTVKVWLGWVCSHVPQQQQWLQLCSLLEGFVSPYLQWKSLVQIRMSCMSK